MEMENPNWPLTADHSSIGNRQQAIDKSSIIIVACTSYRYFMVQFRGLFIDLNI